MCTANIAHLRQPTNAHRKTNNVDYLMIEFHVNIVLFYYWLYWFPHLSPHIYFICVINGNFLFYFSFLIFFWNFIKIYKDIYITHIAIVLNRHHSYALLLFMKKRCVRVALNNQSNTHSPPNNCHWRSNQRQGFIRRTIINSNVRIFFDPPTQKCA